MNEINRKNKSAGRAILVITAICWGLAGVCVKQISWGPMPQICARSIIALIMLVIAKRRLGPGDAGESSHRLQISKINILGAIASCATGMLYVMAIKKTTAGTAIVLQYIAPILVFLFAVLFRQRRARLSEVVITAAVFAGVFLSFFDQLDATHVWGNLLALLSGFTFATQIIIQSDRKASPGDSLIISCMLSFLFALPFTVADLSAGKMELSTQNIVWVLILGIFQYGLANVLFSVGIRKVEKVEASLILTIEPIFNPIPVWLIYGEKMGVLAIIGAVIVIAGVTLYGLLPPTEETARH